MNSWIKWLRCFEVLDGNVKTVQDNEQRIASIANNIQPTETILCANMISEVVKGSRRAS